MTDEDPLALLDLPTTCAAFATALEIGLFWLLDEQPRPASWISAEFSIPPGRCSYWLQLLVQGGWLVEGPYGYRPSERAGETILRRYARDTWALLAVEASERFPALVDLTIAIRAGQKAVARRPDYVASMSRDASRARRFTRMLYELHGQMAEDVSRRIDLTGVDRVIDIGGGSGVVSMALVRRQQRLAAVVADIANVCAAGREIAEEMGLADRITYHPADFTKDELPGGFDLALMCDVGFHDAGLYAKIGRAIDPSGRFVIADFLAPAPGIAPPSRVHWSFERSLFDQNYQTPTASEVEAMLAKARFSVRARDVISAPGRDPLTIFDSVKEA